MATTRNIDGIENARHSQKPPSELLPYLDALTELLANQIMRELQKSRGEDITEALCFRNCHAEGKSRLTNQEDKSYEPHTPPRA